MLNNQTVKVSHIHGAVWSCANRGGTEPGIRTSQKLTPRFITSAFSIHQNAVPGNHFPMNAVMDRAGIINRWLNDAVKKVITVKRIAASGS